MSKTSPELDELIKEVTEGATSPLDRLTSAAGVSAWLGQLGDSVVDHFVSEARASGHSWAEIGTSLGVSRQAAQQRFAEPGVFQQAPLGRDGLREKAAPFAAMRRADAGGIEVQVELDSAWQELAGIGPVDIDGWIAAARNLDPRRWFKRLAEDIDVVASSLGIALGSKVQVVLVDSLGRRTEREVDVTVAKRKAAWEYNASQR